MSDQKRKVGTQALADKGDPGLGSVATGQDGQIGEGGLGTPTAMDSSQFMGAWLVERCGQLTKQVINDAIVPWNTTISSVEKRFEADKKRILDTFGQVEKACEAEVKEDYFLINEIRQRFVGLELGTPEDAVRDALKGIDSTSLEQTENTDILVRCRSDVVSAYNSAKSAREIKESRNALLFTLYQKLGIWIFVSIWIVGALITNGGAGFFIAVATTVGFPFYLASNYISSAESQWTSLVKAIAVKHYWLDHLLIGEAMQKGKNEVETAKREGEYAIATLAVKLGPDVKRLRKDIARVYDEMRYVTASTSDSTAWSTWAPASGHGEAIRLGELTIRADRAGTGAPEQIVQDVDDVEGGRARLSVEADEQADPMGEDVNDFININDIGFTIPIVASLRNGKSIYIRIAEHKFVQHGNDIAQNLILRTLASAPPAKVLFTFIDPIGQGQNVAGFLSLADYDESLVNSKAWTDPRQIERKLTDLTEHMETVIQKYLRTDYATIEDYNKAAGEIAEAYRIVVVFSFPDSISESAARQLERIVQNGGRCGVYAIIVHDVSKKPSYGVNEDNIAKHSLVFAETGGVFSWDSYGIGELAGTVEVDLDRAPPEDLVKSIVQAIGESSKDALKVEVPYSKLLQLSGIDESRVWTGSTANGIQIPIGPGNARKPRFLELGVGLSVHALVVGRPGAGKSNLMHVVITTVARLYSPDELQLYLIDFKKGVEFKPYAAAALPHACVIAIESEREFGISALKSLDDKLKQRGEMFREAGVSDIREYREKTNKRLPRILFLVDEFQEYFIKQDAIADEAALLFDRIVRQGRAFGIHLLLGSQTLAGYSLPKATLNLITVRIALQSSEADSRMILADDNTAARLLSRPGEGIYNASSGLVEGNNLFQVALFKEDDRSQVLDQVAKHMAGAVKKHELSADRFPPPLVFEGHEPAVIEKCGALASLVHADAWPERKRALEVWLGEPVAIRPSITMKVAKRSGSHLLVVSKNEEEAVGVVVAAVVSLAAQVRPGTAEIFILDLTTADENWADVPELMAELLQPHKIEVLGRRGIQDVLTKLASVVKGRTDGEQDAKISHYLILLGMHRARELRQDGNSGRFGFGDDKKPNCASHLAAILRDGPEHGVHVFGWCDSYANLERSLEHGLIPEFGTRVVGPMSSADSSRLIDDDAASHIDRPHRFIKYDEDHVGVLETFRPYALPGRSWLEGVGDALRRRTD